MTDEQRPLVSFCLITYNQEPYVEEAVDAALSQTYSPLEIIISDDASTDATFARIQRRLAERSATGRVVLNRNPVNLGLAEHVNLLTHRLAHGDLIALAAGDDISAPDRITRSVEFLSRHPDVMAVSTALTSIDEKGCEIPPVFPQPTATTVYSMVDYLATPSLHVNGPSRTFRRAVAATFGPLAKGCPTEDSTYLLRCFLMGRVALLDTPLVKYRTHQGNMSAPHNIHRLSVDRITSQYLADVATAERDLMLSGDVKEALLERIEAGARARRAANQQWQSTVRRSTLARLASWARSLMYSRPG